MAGALAAAGGAAVLSGRAIAQDAGASGPVQPTWTSLVANYRYPEWFRDAKLGIWSHWGPQAVPEQGDWYGRLLYMQGDPMYEHHRRTYGHPAETGMIDLLDLWKADRWDPEALMSRYVKAGAKYFVSLACHHDNFDCFDSTYHPWNAMTVGPKRDVVGTWAKAARAAGLRFGVSNHISHAWHWYQAAYGYDAEGPRQGERYDAYKLQRGDGQGKWWDGLDPQALYTGRHMVAPDGIESIVAMNAWHDKNDGQWIESAPPGDERFARTWLLRQMDLVAKYQPDSCYFDDHGLPFGPYGLAAAADYYNRSIAWHGKIDVVLTAKKLAPAARFGLVQDVERGFTNRIWDEPWQTDTCIGDWFYNRSRFTDRSYVGAEGVIQRLADVVSKNGSLLLSIPQRGDGTIDSEEEKILDHMSEWMAINQEAIFDTRPWRIFGEGPTVLPTGMQNEGEFKGFVEGDVRFTVKGSVLYLLALVSPIKPLRLTSLGRRFLRGEVSRVMLLGSSHIEWRQNDDALLLNLPRTNRFVPVIKIEGTGIAGLQSI